MAPVKPSQQTQLVVLAMEEAVETSEATMAQIRTSLTEMQAQLTNAQQQLATQMDLIAKLVQDGAQKHDAAERRFASMEEHLEMLTRDTSPTQAPEEDNPDPGTVQVVGKGRATPAKGWDMASDSEEQPNPADKLTEDFLVEILSRLPYKSLCRFKCVSRRWRSIISHPDHRKVLAQYHLNAFAGVFYWREDCEYHPSRFFRDFTAVSVGGRPHNIHPSLPFLPNCEHFTILDSCNGLLLCRCFETTDSVIFIYIVCNPATEKWVVLPGGFSKSRTACLGFDPAITSHFYVFEFVENEALEPDAYMEDNDRHVKGVYIYSSKTGVWSHKDSGWDFPVSLVPKSKNIFLNGLLYLAIDFAVVAVDVEGTTWRMIPMPHDENPPFIYTDIGSIHLSQGRLWLANIDDFDLSKLSIWVLEDHGSEVWILKHSVKCLNLFGLNNVEFRDDYNIVAIQPEQNKIFLVYGYDKVLMSYEMDSGRVQFIHELGNDSHVPYIPYAPLYSKSLADGY